MGSTIKTTHESGDYKGLVHSFIILREEDDSDRAEEWVIEIEFSEYGLEDAEVDKILIESFLDGEVAPLPMPHDAWSALDDAISDTAAEIFNELSPPFDSMREYGIPMSGPF